MTSKLKNKLAVMRMAAREAVTEAERNAWVAAMFALIERESTK